MQHDEITAMRSDVDHGICVLKMLSLWRDTGTEERPRTVRDLLSSLDNDNTLCPRKMLRDLNKTVSGTLISYYIGNLNTCT